MDLTVVGVLTGSVAFLASLIFLVRLLANLRSVVVFKGDYKETQAKLTGFESYYRSTDHHHRPTYTPILSYYNEYIDKQVEKKFSGAHIFHEGQGITKKEKMRVAKPGEFISIQYTASSERVIDERYISKHEYELKHYLRPFILSIVFFVFGFILTIIGILR